jgi:uncharacterized protein YjbI with pentapeptide repeats
MKIQIKNRDKKVIIEGEAENLKEFLKKNLGVSLWEAYLRGANLEEADLREADLRGADLRLVDLSGVDLSGANLRGADLRGAKIKATQEKKVLKSLGIITKE